jgi:hypothetical protein
VRLMMKGRAESKPEVELLALIMKMPVINGDRPQREKIYRHPAEASSLTVFIIRGTRIPCGYSFLARCNSLLT